MTMSDLKTILVTGASGLIGSALCAALRQRGHTVRTLSRSKGDVHWDIQAGTLDVDALDGVDAVVHLAGEPIAQRWSDAAKQRILDSRVKGTGLLAERIAACPQPPSFICASGINFYGFNPGQVVDEDNPSGEGFLAKVCREWEAATGPAMEAGARTVLMRTGIVLSAQGGALAKMLPPFKMGVGGRIGDGRQGMSWISLPDLVQAYIFAIENDSVQGAVNAVAPEPVTNQVFTKTLGSVLGRPTIFPLPAAVVKTLFGEMGNETVLADLSVQPVRLKAFNFEWTHRELEAALRAVL
jgi:uncharacterized protein (TIGR01777 family)